MAENEPDWQHLEKLWRSTPTDTLPDLTAQLRRRTRWIWLLTALDVLATVAALGWIAWAGRDGLDPVESWFAGFAIILLLIAWPVGLYARRGTWSLRESGPEAALEFAIRRCTASIRLARINQAAMVIGVVTGIVLRFTDLGPGQYLALDESSRDWARLAASLLFLGWMAGAEWYARRKHRERERLRTLLAECRDG